MVGNWPIFPWEFQYYCPLPLYSLQNIHGEGGRYVYWRVLLGTGLGTFTTEAFYKVWPRDSSALSMWYIFALKMWFENLISLSSSWLLNHFIFSVWKACGIKLQWLVVKYWVGKNKPPEVGYRLEKNTFYCFSHECHWLEADDLDELLSARPQHVADKQKTMRSCRSNSLSLTQYRS